MAIIKCKMCGGDIALSADKTFGTCEYCGCSMTLPRVEDDRRAAAFNRGNHFRRIGEFDKALEIYEGILRENDRDAEAHWCCALCRFGIEYVEDPDTLEWFPTCHRASFDSFLEDVDYLAALEYSDGITQRQYRKDGVKIAEVQKGILAASQNASPYDVFLCYKESDENGSRTRDSLLTQEIYYRLTEQGRRVFFSRITLEDVTGTQYEPYIFAALNSAKVMIVVGTKPDHLNAPWVKNEWSRFLAMMKKDHSKLLLPCYSGFDPYDLPEQLCVLQSYDMSRIGFLQDLTRGIAKVLDVEKPVPKETVVVQQTAANAAPLLKRAFLFLEDGDWKTADEYCEKVLDMDPENGEAYLCKLMALGKVRTEAELGKADPSFVDTANYQKAMRFGDESLRQRLENARMDTVYHAAKRLAQSASPEGEKVALMKAAQCLETVPGWRDGDDLIRKYRQRIAEMEAAEEAERREQQLREKLAREREEERRRQARKNARKTARKVKTALAVVAFAAAVVILVHSVVLPMLAGKEQAPTEAPVLTTQPQQTVSPEETTAPDPRAEAYAEAEALLASGETAKAAIAFGRLGDYEDARDRSFALWQKVPYRKTICTWKDEDNQSLIYALQKDCSVSVDAHICKFCGDGLTDSEIAGHHTAGYRDIVSLQASRYGVIGLRCDGTLVLPNVEDPWYQELSQWSDIVHFSATYSKVNNAEHDVYFGVKSDGTIVSAGTSKAGVREVGDWKDIVCVVSSGIHTLGLRSDGTVIAAGDNFNEQCNVDGWTDIIAILTGPHQSYALKADGSMVATGTNAEGVIQKVSQWKNVAVLQQPSSLGASYPMAFQEDGKFLAGWYMDKKSPDVAACINGTPHNLLVLKNDGTLWGGSVEAGSRAAEWTDIQIPYLPKQPIGNQRERTAVYAEAEALLASGETAKAAIAFGRLGDYEDARERSMALWEQLPYPRETISAGDTGTLAILKDGTVRASNIYNQQDIAAWKDIVAVSVASHYNAVGLKSDGTVVASFDPEQIQTDVSGWTDIVSVSAGNQHTVGLKADGTVVATGRNEDHKGNYLGQCDVSGWTDIVAVAAGSYITVGLKSDGTVVKAGADYFNYDEVTRWTDITAIAAGQAHIVGLKADGTVVAVGNDTFGECKVSGWTDIVAICTGSYHTIGLKADGTAVAVGHNGENRRDVSHWKDVVAATAGYSLSLGLKSNGSVVAAGSIAHWFSDWKDIKVPTT